MEKHGFCHVFCLQKPYLYRNIMFATALIVFLHPSAPLSVHSSADAYHIKLTTLRLTSSLTVLCNLTSFFVRAIVHIDLRNLIIFQRDCQI